MAGLLSSPAAMGWPVRGGKHSGTMDPPYRSQLLRDVASAIRARHFSRQTERAYVHWVRRFVLHHGRRHPAELGVVEVNAFLTSLAVKDKVAASTQAQARAALLFLYREVLRTPLEPSELHGSIVRAKQPQRLPVVLTRGEVRAVLAGLVPPPGRLPSSSTGRDSA